MTYHARAIFSGGGGVKCLLTAFIAAVVAALLLTASAGTAEAQSVSFSATTGVLKEPPIASGAPMPQPFTVTVTRSADTVAPVTFTTTPALTGTGYGDITVTGTPTLGANNTINFTGNQAVLSFVQANDDNWKDEKFIIALRAPAGTRIGADLVISTDDHENQPSLVFREQGGFNHLSTISLTEASLRDFDLVVDLYPRQSGSAFPNTELQTLTGMANRIRISVDPPDVLGKTIALTQVSSSTTIGAAHVVANKPGQYDLPLTVAEAARFPKPATIRFSVMAIADTTGFRNPKITLTGLEQDKGTSGTLLASQPLVIEVLSDEQVPTVYFSPTDISIKEGGSTTAALVSEGKQGAEVNTVKLAVDGAAMVDLYKGDTKLEPKDGVITVDLKDTNLARLTARSMSDRSLLDGQMKSKTWRITDADGANIDSDANLFTVTVEGSTAVPALPLVAQLLLALFLTAGGARLYRRRR